MLTVSSLLVRYAESDLFRTVNFALKPGECLHITGPNGVGKSTLLRVLAGMKLCHHGEVHWADEIQIVYLGHALGLMQNLTTAENIDFYAQLYDVTYDLSELKQRYDLESIWQQPINRLSRGQSQRVALARLSMSRPRSVWLLDEPLTGLDHHYQNIFFQHIQWQLARGGSVLLVSHLESLPVMHQQLRLVA